MAPLEGHLCGVDEVGRGPLAGSVVAACVVLDLRARPIAGVDDSKKLTHEAREELAPLIRERALAWGLGEASVEEIDTLNIYHASHLAMRRALEALTASAHAPLPALVLVDGNRTVPGVAHPQRALVGGDALSASIAAASILAKVERDRALVEAHSLYPQYGFARHKGYATREHRDALREHGPCPLHRRSFRLDSAKVEFAFED
ncbi:MAG TPA: ribonuclease HII [Fibrobacteria bacterium]|nr:ribonuclease HII [Fibrobacteria bacterium]